MFDSYRPDTQLVFQGEGAGSVLGGMTQNLRGSGTVLEGPNSVFRGPRPPGPP